MTQDDPRVATLAEVLSDACPVEVLSGGGRWAQMTERERAAWEEIARAALAYLDPGRRAGYEWIRVSRELS